MRLHDWKGVGAIALRFKMHSIAIALDGWYDRQREGGREHSVVSKLVHTEIVISSSCKHEMIGLVTPKKRSKVTAICGAQVVVLW